MNSLGGPRTPSTDTGVILTCDSLAIVPKCPFASWYTMTQKTTIQGGPIQSAMTFDAFSNHPLYVLVVSDPLSQCLARRGFVLGELVRT